MFREKMFQFIQNHFAEIDHDPTNPDEAIPHLSRFDHADLSDFKDELDKKQDWLSIAR